MVMQPLAKTRRPLSHRERLVVVTEQGEVHFFDDIYGLDAQMEEILAKGYPYPA